MMLFLILSPGLERRLGFGRYMLCLAGTAVFVGLGHIAFGSQNSILGGASGWVFMMIILATFAGNEPGTVSIPTILVGVMYAGQEIGGALGPGNVSHLAHLLGGVCGLAAGMVGLVRDEKVRHAPTESLVAASNGRAG
jgi:membrane associated rhomboid family serine protease